MTRVGVEAWKEHLTPVERVQTIVLGVPEPRSAEHIAEEAAVSVETAREHLDSLVELTILLEHNTGNQTKDEPDPLYMWLQTARDLLDSHDREGLIEIRNELQAQIQEWRSEHDADSPDTLRERTVKRESSPDTQDTRRTANEWERAEYRLNLIANVINNRL